MTVMKKWVTRFVPLKHKKIPYQLVIGDKEVEEGTVTVRRYGSKETVTMTVEAYLERVQREIANFSRPLED